MEVAAVLVSLPFTAVSCGQEKNNLWKPLVNRKETDMRYEPAIPWAVIKEENRIAGKGRSCNEEIAMSFIFFYFLICDFLSPLRSTMVNP